MLYTTLYLINKVCEGIERMKIIKFSRKYIFKYKLLFSTFIVTIIFITNLTFFQTYISGVFIDFLIGFKNIKFLYKYVIIFGIASILGIITNILNGYIGTKIQGLVSYKMSKDIFVHMTHLPDSYTKSIDTTYFSQRINTDCNVITSFFIDTFINLFVNVFVFGISIFIIIKLDIRIAVILGILAIIYFVVYIVFRKPIYNKMLRHKENSSSFFSSFFECINNIEFIKKHSIMEIYRKRLDQSFTKVMSSLLDYQKVQIGLTGSDSIITTLGMLTVYIVGGLSILSNKLTVGAFTITLNLFNGMLNSVKIFLNFGKAYQETLVSYNRIEEILNIPYEKNGNILLDTINKIELKNVSFKYGDQNVIKNFSYTFRKGNIYFLIGCNGVGKSTLLNLISGEHINDYTGSILFNDIDICKLDICSLRKKNIGFSEQETILLADTVQNNLELFIKYKDTLNNYIERLDLLSCISQLDNGIKTLINSQQNNISGGEKQKISIIRQLLLNPEVMLFDEPTSALEIKSKINFMDILREIKKDKIIIIVTHDKMLYNEGEVIIDMNLERESWRN